MDKISTPGEKHVYKLFLSETLKETDNSEDIVIDEKIILKWILK